MLYRTTYLDFHISPEILTQSCWLMQFRILLWCVFQAIDEAKNMLLEQLKNVSPFLARLFLLLLTINIFHVEYFILKVWHLLPVDILRSQPPIKCFKLQCWSMFSNAREFF